MTAISMKKHNFYAGPAILPQSVFEEAARAVNDFNGQGLSILEISHRSKDFAAVMAETESLVREIGGIDDRYAVLFLTGGASTQFFMAPMNFLRKGEKAAYVETGAWSSKAIKEARLFGNIEVPATSKERNFSFIPKGFDVPEDAAYLPLTSNNTIYGTQYKKYPETGIPLIADMSSDMFSRPFDINRFAMLYAGAQKNIGPAGVTLAIVRKDWLGRSGSSIPTMLNYKIHAEKGSTFNTPPVFPIYVMMLTLRWIKAKGGLEAINRRNTGKANTLYAEIDANPCFAGTVANEDRSLMNVCFLPSKPEYEAPFLEMCEAAGITGIKGHRSVGGFRASIYNAMGKESVLALVEVMRDFAAKQG